MSTVTPRRPFAVRDVYLLLVHEPRPHPVLAGGHVNVVIVHALTLLRSDLPQPDAARVYRCLTEFPGRIPGCVVPLSTLSYELDNGRLWPEVADWEAVSAAVVRLAFTTGQGQCRSLPLHVDYPYDALLAGGPYAVIRHDATSDSWDLDGPVLGTSQRRAMLNLLADQLADRSPSAEVWAGGETITPAADPAVMPYHPHGT
jgi:hypothetical protein